MTDEDFDAEDVLSSIGDDQIAKFLKDRGWEVFKDLSEIDDYDIEQEYVDRCLDSQCGKGLENFNNFELQDALESAGFIVLAPGDTSEIETLYQRRLCGYDISKELEEIILSAANRIV